MSDTAYDRFTAALREHGRQVKENGHGKAQAQCPAHDDRNPSLSVTAIDGRVLICCQAGCTNDDVVAALGLRMADLFDNRNGRDYAYSGGRRTHRRYEGNGAKTFWQSGNKADTSLYGAERVTPDTKVIFAVEGEQDVDAARVLGVVAVSAAMGAGKANRADWTPCYGKSVIVIADKDEPGHRHAADIARILAGHVASLGVFEAAQGCKDLADHIAAGHTIDDLVRVAGADEYRETCGDIDGAALLDALVTWFGRFIRVTDTNDLPLLTLWTAHTHLVRELYTTPRLLIDSIMEGAGKTTVIDHLNRLCVHPVQAATINSPALLPRLLERGMRTILIDEAHRTLRPDRPGVEDLLGIINTGYRKGATRPVLVPTKGGGWDAKEMTTYAPVAMAGNHPNLPPDTVSRQIRIVLMPDLDGSIEDSDWESIEDDAAVLCWLLAAWAEGIRDDIKRMDVELPAGCIGRCKEKWRPLARVAAAGGGTWPATVRRLIEADMAQEAAEREAGLRKLPPGMVAMLDLRAVWPEAEPFYSTRHLVAKLVAHNLDYWGSGSPYGKQLTDTRLARLINDAAKVTSVRPGGIGPRGYHRLTLEPVWRRLGIPPGEPGKPGEPGEPGYGQTEITGLTGSTGFTGLSKGSTANPAADSAHCLLCDAQLTQSESITRGYCAECAVSANTNREEPTP